MEKELTLFKVPAVKSPSAQQRCCQRTKWVKAVVSLLGSASLTEYRSVRKRRSGSFKECTCEYINVHFDTFTYISKLLTVILDSH